MHKNIVTFSPISPSQVMALPEYACHTFSMGILLI